MDEKIELSQNNINKFQIARVFKENTARINSVDFDQNGDVLVTGSDDDSIHLYDVNTARLKKMVNCKRYGVNCIRFTHHIPAVICASRNPRDQAIRYLSLHDNQYIRFFPGHGSQVVSLEMSPNDDCFISGSVDRTVRLWDLRTPTCKGVLKTEGRPAVSYDNEGMIFAVACGHGLVKLYDARNYLKGPFSTFSYQEKDIDWRTIAQSPNGKFILLTTKKIMVLMDAYSGDTLQTFAIQGSNSCLSGCFSPDSKYVFCGSSTGNVHSWDANTSAALGVWAGHPNPTGVVAWNPKKSMLVSACNYLAFWLPKIDSPATSPKSSLAASFRQMANNSSSGEPSSSSSQPNHHNNQPRQPPPSSSSTTSSSRMAGEGNSNSMEGVEYTNRVPGPPPLPDDAGVDDPPVPSAPPTISRTAAPPPPLPDDDDFIH